MSHARDEDIATTIAGRLSPTAEIWARGEFIYS
jgi:hypothetical protein